MKNPREKIINTHAFTTTAIGGVFGQLRTDASVLEPSTISKGKAKKYSSIWDTGAVRTCITPKIVKAIGLIPSGKTNVNGAGGQLKNQCLTYIVNIVLPQGVIIPNITVTELPNLTACDILIGMDVITKGDFAISNVNGATTFSFRVPSIKTVDFVKEHNRAKASKGKATHLTPKKKKRKRRK